MRVEGIRAVEEALAAGAPPRFAVVAPRLERTERGRALLERLAGGVETVRVDDATLASVSEADTPQGVVLVCGEPNASLADLPVGGRFLVMDAVRDPGNAGTLVRTAVAFALDGVIALPGTADPWSVRAVRASAGMAFRMPIVRASTKEALEWMAARAVRLLAADARGGDVAAEDAAPPWALAVGNEGEGPGAAVRGAAVRSVSVPMAGPAESLNAATAAAVLLYVLTREASGA